MKRRIVFPVALVLFLTSIFLLLARAPAKASGDSAENQWQFANYKLAPDFALPSLAGDTLRLSDDRGKIVVLNVWATWCAPCRKETPDFVKLQREFAAAGVQFIGVSIDEEGFDVVRPFAEEFQVNYPLVVDDGTFQSLYREITAVPTTFLINRIGEIWAYMPGALSLESLRPILSMILEKESEAKRADAT